MNQKPTKSGCAYQAMAAFAAAAGLLLCSSAGGQTIPNPSFEANTFNTYPGFISDNAPITGWTVDNPSRAGLNPAGGASLYADNGTVPDGNQVAFLQSGATLSTTMSGLTAGQKYLVTFRANSQTPASPGEFPNVHVSAASQDVWNITYTNLGGANPYGYLAFEFTATAATENLSVANDSIYETALLLDDFRIAVSAGKWTVDQWNDDTDSGVDPSYVYTHAYSFGSTASPVINSILFTGVGGPNPAVPGVFSTTNLGSVYGAPDDNNVTGNSSVLADTFVYQGGDISTNFETITITGLTNGTDYVATIYSVGWESPSLITRWEDLNSGSDYLTINQDMFGNNNGIRCAYHYKADASGSVTLRIAPVQPINTSMHIYGFSNREAVARNLKPQITLQPQGTTVSEGLEVALKVGATGFPAPTFRWRLNGADISGANTDTYTFTAAPAGAGNYDVIVANFLGSVTSVVAKVTVGIPLLNPSFEADLFSVWPGYVSANGPITSWNSLGGHGLNPVADGTSPFADNGAVPHGTHVAFMQTDGNIDQVVTGFTVGSEYYVHYYENGRTGPAGALAVTMGANTVVPAHLVPAAGGSNPYTEVSSDVFTATATDLDLTFIKSNPQGGDSTVLIDNVAIVRVPAGTAPSVGLQPQPLTVYVGSPASFSVRAQGSLPLHYQWQFNGAPIANATDNSLTIGSVGLANEGNYALVITNSFGSVTSSVVRLSLLEKIVTLHSTGLDASDVALPGGTIDPFWALLTNPDGGSPDVYVANDGWPIQAGVWMVNSATSKWVGSRAGVSGAIPAGAFLYRTTFDLTGRDTNTVTIAGQWATDDAGTTVVLNGTPLNVPLAAGFGSWTTFTITTNNASFLRGTNTLDFGLSNGSEGPSGLRVEFTSTSARTLPGVPASIAAQPQGGIYTEGDTVTLTVTAAGTLPLSFQWMKNGANLTGKTDSMLTLASVTSADSGNYQVVVNNPYGTATSSNAFVDVAYRVIPVAYGTGVSSAGQLLDPAAVDVHFILGLSSDPDHSGPDAIVLNDGYPIQPGTWLMNGPNSKWIGPWANQNDQPASGGGSPGGPYTYQTSVNLTGYDVTKVRLVGGWAADDSGADILVNGVSTGWTAAGFGALTPFVITNNLVAGANTLDFLVTNGVNQNGTPNPTGLRVDLKALIAIDRAPTMQLARSGSSATISWSPDTAGVKLQSAPALTGPWTDVQNQANPYTTSVTGGMQFFRLTK